MPLKRTCVKIAVIHIDAVVRAVDDNIVITDLLILNRGLLFSLRCLKKECIISTTQQAGKRSEKNPSTR